LNESGQQPQRNRRKVAEAISAGVFNESPQERSKKSGASARGEAAKTPEVEHSKQASEQREAQPSTLCSEQKMRWSKRVAEKSSRQCIQSSTGGKTRLAPHVLTT
jgi:hypothetical protein